MSEQPAAKRLSAEAGVRAFVGEDSRFRAPSLDAMPPAVYALFMTLVVGLTWLQKLGLPMGGDRVLGLPLPLMLAALAVRYLRYRALEIDAKRLVTYLFFCVCGTLSQSLSKHDFGVTAMILLFALYLPVVVRIEVDRKTYLKCMNAFQMTMVAVALIVLAQQVMQRLWGFQSWPDMTRIMPEKIQVPNYNYWREMGYKVGLFQPNAIFFLEPSFVSQFLALAVVIELIFFERLHIVALLTVALFLVFAGTGLLILACTAPFLLARLSPKLLVGVLIAAVLLVMVGAPLGWFDQFVTRANEINEPGTSGYYRFTVPFMNLMNSVRDWDAALFGSGAGKQVDFVGVLYVPMAVNKLMDEYGLVTTISFYVCFSYALFEAAPSAIVAWALFVCFNFCGGALAVPVYVIVYITLGTLLRIKPGPAPGSGVPARAMTRPESRQRPEAKSLAVWR